MDRYICIHGHFYQPPRENPWLEHIELQDSAHPYHDWNERITAECYAPNSRSRILDSEHRIVDIVNNYAKISYNFGPTLLSWLQLNAPETYEAILAADRESAAVYSGHGSAMAQAYNHMILPLAVARDKYTQIRWGVQDFIARFGRHPEGMWLPETAVDTESLAIMAAHGIKFTVLSPFQAARVRRIGTRAWSDAHGGRLDPSMPYRVRLKSGKSIAVFFYDGPISTGVAFEGLLNRGESLADRLVGAFSTARSWPQIVSIATDGETYGHHHRHGEMALSYALRYLQNENLARLTNYGEFLEKHAPFEEVEVIENSAWSCAHGVGRWTANCGCCSGSNGNWNQEWRAPLRAALDWLRDSLAPVFERQGARLFAKPWAVRNDYVCVVLNRSGENADRFLKGHCHRELRANEKVRALKLLEMQRHAMLMYTSCGWFFDEISGIETVQVLAYAARALQLAGEVTGFDFEPRFLDLLEKAESNVAEHRNGRRIYEKFVKPAMVDLEKVGAHYAVSSLFNGYGDVSRTYAYTVERQDHRSMGEAHDRVVVGRARITSEITSESLELTFGVVRIGEAGVGGGVRKHRGKEAYEELAGEITSAFEHGDLPSVMRLLDREFGAGAFGVRNLFRDDQRRIVALILAETLQQAENMYREFYRARLPLMRFVTSLGMSLPSALLYAAQVTIKNGLRRCFESEPLDYAAIDGLLNEARKTRVDLGSSSLEFALRHTVERIAGRFRQEPLDVDALQALESAVDLATKLPFPVDLWKCQNWFYEVLSAIYPARVREAGTNGVGEWLDHFRALGRKLSVRVDRPI